MPENHIADANAVAQSLSELTAGWAPAPGVDPATLTAARAALAATVLAVPPGVELRPPQLGGPVRHRGTEPGGGVARDRPASVGVRGTTSRDTNDADDDRGNPQSVRRQHLEPGGHPGLGARRPGDRQLRAVPGCDGRRALGGPAAGHGLRAGPVRRGRGAVRGRAGPARDQEPRSSRPFPRPAAERAGARRGQRVVPGQPARDRFRGRCVYRVRDHRRDADQHSAVHVRERGVRGAGRVRADADGLARPRGPDRGRRHRRAGRGGGHGRTARRTRDRVYRNQRQLAAGRRRAGPGVRQHVTLHWTGAARHPRRPRWPRC